MLVEQDLKWRIVDAVALQILKQGFSAILSP